MEESIEGRLKWTELEQSVHEECSSSEEKYIKYAFEYTRDRHLSWEETSIRHYMTQMEFYQLVVRYLSERLSPYPYHYQRFLVRGEFPVEEIITPYRYYKRVLGHALRTSTSYEGIPSISAIAIFREVGVGRNQYISLANECTTSTGNIDESLLHRLLPALPTQLKIAPEWQVQSVQFSMQQVEQLPEDEYRTFAAIRAHDDKSGSFAGNYDLHLLQQLHRQGLICFHVHVAMSDRFTVPDVTSIFDESGAEVARMNTRTDDEFETLLYAISISVNRNRALMDLATSLHQNTTLVRDAVSLSVRLNLLAAVHEHHNPVSRWHKSFEKCSDQANDKPAAPPRSSSVEFLQNDLSATQLKRIGLLYDAKLVASLMVGQFPVKLKQFAMKFFDTGKLSHDDLGQIIELLDSVEAINVASTDDRHHFYIQAVVLRMLLTTFRKVCDGLEFDLLRYENLLELPVTTRKQLLKNNYAAILPSIQLTHVVKDKLVSTTAGTPVWYGSLSSKFMMPWLHFFFGYKIQSGVPALFFPRGSRFIVLPFSLQIHDFYELYLISEAEETPWEIKIVSKSAVLVEIHRWLPTVHVFLRVCTKKLAQEVLPLNYTNETPKTEVEIMTRLQSTLSLSSCIGQATFVKLNSLGTVLNDVDFGLPDENLEIATSLFKFNRLNIDVIQEYSTEMEDLITRVKDFIESFAVHETLDYPTPISNGVLCFDGCTVEFIK